MVEKDIDWAAIASHPKFVELHQAKMRFHVGLWVLGATSYFLLLVGAISFPDLFNTRIMGRLNFGYLFCLSQFVLAWAIAIVYTRKSNREFDPLTSELIEMILKEKCQ